MSDGYQPTPLPDFIQVAMGTKAPRGTPTHPAGEVVQTSKLVKHVTPSSADMTHCEQHVPPATRSRPPDTNEKRSRPREAEPTPSTSASVTHVSTRSQRTDNLAKSTVTAVLAIPVWIIVIGLLIGLLSDHGDEPIVVNDTYLCERGPKVVTAAELGTNEYWKEC